MRCNSLDVMIFAGNDSKLGFPATESSELLVANGVFRHEIFT